MYPTSSPEAHYTLPPSDLHSSSAAAAAAASASASHPPAHPSSASRDADPSSSSIHPSPENSHHHRPSLIDSGLSDWDIPEMSQHPPVDPSPVDDFQILDWYPAYQSCQHYFLTYAQHEPATQAVCALINIRLPFQWRQNPIFSFAQRASPSPMAGPPPSAYRPYPRDGGAANHPSSSTGGHNIYSSPASIRDSPPPSNFVSVVPYLRRLIVTGFDQAAILHGFFGDKYAEGTSRLLECERRNYVFAAKHGGWKGCKEQYDMGSGGGDDETVPFMKPLKEAKPGEFAAYQDMWDEWTTVMEQLLVPGDGTGSGKQKSKQGYGDSGSTDQYAGRRG